MIIYKDAVSGDEMFSDSYKMKLVDGVVYQVEGKQVTQRGGVDGDLIGANPSAEGGDEGTDEAVISGVNVVLSNRLVETAFAKKKDYQTYIKGYMKCIKTSMEEKGEDCKEFMTGAAKFVKEVCDDFGEYQFFLGESMNADGMVALMKWDGETPYLYFFKHGLNEEKV